VDKAQQRQWMAQQSPNNSNKTIPLGILVVLTGPEMGQLRFNIVAFFQKHCNNSYTNQ
jgi:hypothetical protein